MASTIALRQASVTTVEPRATAEPTLVRGLLITIALLFLGLFLCLPLAAVFVQAFQKGVAAYLAALR